MRMLILTTLLGFAVGMIGTGTGGAIAFFLNNPGRRFMSVILGVSSGLMLAIVCFDLLPESFHIGGYPLAVIGILAGVFIIVIVEHLMPRVDIYKEGFTKESYIKTGILLGIGIAIHNFPEGLAIGSGFMATRDLGIGLAITIAFHNMPEGIAMAVPISVGGVSKFKVFLYTILAGIPMGIGAFIGVLLGEISPALIALCLSFAGGAMLYITCGELIPKSLEIYRGRIPTISIIIGFVVGIVIAVAL